MAKIKAALERVARALKIQHALRARAVRRMTARHKEQVKAEKQASAAAAEAERCRARGEVAKAHRKDGKAERLDAKADRAKRKAIAYKRVARRKAQQIHKLQVDRKSLEARAATMKPHVGKDGRVAGADDRGEAFIFANRYIAARCAATSRPNFYDMYGSGFNVHHALLKGDQPHIGQMSGERSDCSLFGTETCWAAKLPDPNGTGFTSGWTATALGQHNGWRIVSEQEMRKKGWGIVIYLRWNGDREGHHWEDYVGEGGDETIGHGSAPVDPGVIDLFGNGLYACLIHEED
jgi:hypothetical protein